MCKLHFLLLNTASVVFFFLSGCYLYNYKVESSLSCNGVIDSSNTPLGRGFDYDLNGYVALNLDIDNVIIYLANDTATNKLLKSAQVEQVHNWMGHISGLRVISTTGYQDKQGLLLSQHFNILKENTVYDFYAKKVGGGIYLVKIGMSTFFCQTLQD